jgi:hypothetical protein
MIDVREISRELAYNSTSTADDAGETEMSDDRSIVITSPGVPCSDAGMDPCIHIEERGGREMGYDNRVDQTRVMGNRVWACLDDGCVLPHMGLPVRETSSREESDRTLFIHHVPVTRAPDRGSGYYISSTLITPVHLSGVHATTSACRPTKQLEDIMKAQEPN